MTTQERRASISVMSEHDLDLEVDLDDFVFEPNGWDLASTMGITVDPKTDREHLDELADAMLVWADESVLEPLTDAALERIWDDDLQRMIREGLVSLSDTEGWVNGVAIALEAFDRDPRRAEVTREVVRHLAMQLGHVGTPVFFCLDCLDEEISRAPASGRRGIAARAAVVTVRNLDVIDGSPAQRRAVRAQLGRLGELGRQSLRSLAAELRLIAEEPLPKLAADDVWGVICAQFVAERVHAG